MQHEILVAALCHHRSLWRRRCMRSARIRGAALRGGAAAPAQQGRWSHGNIPQQGLELWVSACFHWRTLPSWGEVADICRESLQNAGNDPQGSFTDILHEVLAVPMRLEAICRRSGGKVEDGIAMVAAFVCIPRNMEEIHLVHQLRGQIFEKAQEGTLREKGGNVEHHHCRPLRLWSLAAHNLVFQGSSRAAAHLHWWCWGRIDGRWPSQSRGTADRWGWFRLLLGVCASTCFSMRTAVPITLFTGRVHKSSRMMTALLFCCSCSLLEGLLGLDRSGNGRAAAAAARFRVQAAASCC
mmetsp:Transcript_52838/g.126184  ORF Transcript_52838/g.126184 Transcript_52838/m.126184 type:complete len:297 (-) Transcript_52838:805-1695(-)